jgi:RNA polymerase sigma-70 factor, ECF subfamily
MDRVEFEQLVKEHWSVIRTIARRFGQGHDIDDICQETLIIAWRRRDTIQNVAGFGPWVRMIALNVGRAHTRRRMTTIGPAEVEALPGNDETKAILDGDALAEALHSLTERERLTVEAHHVIGWPLAEIAAAFEEPLGSTKSRLSRARVKLRGELTRMGWMPSVKQTRRSMRK